MKKIEDIDEKYIDIIKRAQLYRECREYLIMGVGFRELKEDAPEEIKRKYSKRRMLRPQSPSYISLGTGIPPRC